MPLAEAKDVKNWEGMEQSINKVKLYLVTCVSPRFSGIETKMKIIIKKLEHFYTAFPANISKPVMLMKATLCQQCVAATNCTAGALLSWCGFWEPPQLGTLQPQSNTQQKLTHSGDVNVPDNVGPKNWAEKIELVEWVLAAGWAGADISLLFLFQTCYIWDITHPQAQSVPAHLCHTGNTIATICQSFA